MNIAIKNDSLTVRIASLGAQMQSFRDAQETEYLWNGNPAYWTGRAPHIFPYVGRLTNNTYSLNGKLYLMGRHGFARDSYFMIEEKSEDTVTFLLTDDENTRSMYPFRFALCIVYRLSGSRLSIQYVVENTGNDTMFFGLGSHPGFMVPLESGLGFEDYHLEFDETKTPVHIGLNDAGFCTGGDKTFPLQNGRKLPLSHVLFDSDAVVLSDMANSVTLKSDIGTKALRVSYPKMRYLGFWHKPKTDAPHVCIEPWTSLPSREGVVEDLSQQEDLIALPQGKIYENAWTIEVLRA